MRKLFTLLILLALTVPLSAQLFEVPLAHRIEASSLIVEGKVISSKCYWDNNRYNIYTSYLIEVNQVLKGSAHPETVEVVALGGQVVDHAVIVSHGIGLAQGEYGIFFLNPFHFEPQFPESSKTYQVYAGSQGFISFHNGLITDPFHIYLDPLSEIYRPITLGDIGGPSEAAAQFLSNSSGRSASTSIDTLYPTTITAGTRDTLFIGGTEFGDTTGIVSFTNADDGGLSFFQTAGEDIISWTDTLVKVFVPSIGPATNINAGTAGTGVVRIETVVGDQATSTDSIAVVYAINNQRSAATFEANYRYLTNVDGLGGLVFRFDSTFSNDTLARPVFEKSLRDWRCLTGINLKIGNDTTTLPLADDGVSQVRRSIPSDLLPQGTLGLTISRRRICVDTTLRNLFPVDEIDIVLRDTSFMFYDTIATPGPSEADFYSLTMHELGHAHQLMHVLDPPSLMHFARSLGASMRSVDPTQIDGANWVMDSSTTNHVFCPSPMIAVSQLDCNTLNSIQPQSQENGISYERVYPNPSDGNFEMELELEPGIRLENITIFDGLGRKSLVLEDGFNRAGNILVPFEFNTLPKGMLFIHVFTSKGSTTFKMIIQ